MGSASEFAYIAERIRSAPFRSFPFAHLLIENLLSPEHFAMLLTDRQVHFPPVASESAVFGALDANGYVVQRFPGCITDPAVYLDCLERDAWPTQPEVEEGEGLLEGFGMCYRLERIDAPRIAALQDYLRGAEFKSALEEKLCITEPTRIDTGIQKYLTGYEISPHPDTRAKSVTYLLNINKFAASEQMDIHTHLLRLKPEWAHIERYWAASDEIDRKWLPWSWCETVATTPLNNSMLIFRCHDRSLHAVKLRYDHKPFQRTQIYGNLWYTSPPPRTNIFYKDLQRLAEPFRHLAPPNETEAV